MSKLTITGNGAEYDFVLRPKVTLAQESFISRMNIQCAKERGEDPQKTDIAEILRFILFDPERTKECMRVAYEGPVDSIDWHNDVSSEEVGAAVGIFFLSIFRERMKIRNANLKSLSNTATKSNQDTKPKRKTTTSGTKRGRK